MITQIEAQKIHKEVRDWFKGQFKTGNKQYIIAQNDSHFFKKNKRNQNAHYADNYVNYFSNPKNIPSVTGHPTLDMGRHLYYMCNIPGQARAGNCYQYTALTLFFAGRAKVTANVYIVNAYKDNADHSFCLFSHSTTLPQRFSIAQMTSFDEATWAVDPWANIVCPAYLYTNNLFLKMRAWEKQGKEIYRFDDEQWTTATQFYSDLTNSHSGWSHPNILACELVL